MDDNQPKMYLWIIAYQYTQYEDEFEWLHYASAVEPNRDTANRLAREQRRENMDTGLTDEDGRTPDFPNVLYVTEARDPLYINNLVRKEG